MKPLDPRLIRWAASVKWLLVGLIAIGTTMAILIIFQANLLATSIVTIFQEKRIPGNNILLFLLVVFAIRALLSWLSESLASRAAVKAKSDLRIALAKRLLSADQPVKHSPAELTYLSTRGIDALDSYFSRYLPQLVLALIVPATLSFVVLLQDWVSAVLLFITLPLIPVFAILIGLYTKVRADQQLNSLTEISNYFTDVISGLSTLRIFGRTAAQSKNLEQIDDRYRKNTMGVLRVSFLSSLALELLASVSVAMIAVGIGLRLVDGEFDLKAGLFILILTPEIYLPLRAVGAQFHAATEGITAADQILTYLETPSSTPESIAVVNQVQLTNFQVARGELILPRIDLVAKPGSLTVLTGPSGSGKTSIFRALLGTSEIRTGEIRINGELIANPISLRSQISWLPQHATNMAGTVLDILRLAKTDLTVNEAEEMLFKLGLPPAELSNGLQTQIDESGQGVSVGQRRKIALGRALLRATPILLLDEPTASLDAESEAVVIRAILDECSSGRIVICSAHGSKLIDQADQLIDVSRRWVGA